MEQKGAPIRILQVFSKMYPAGAESMLMNLYRNIDRDRIQFDFVVHTQEKDFFDDEIERLGGRIFRVPRFNGINIVGYINAWKEIFKQHPECKIIHSHIRSTASIFLYIANRYDLITISHSHSTSEGKGFQALVKRMMELPLRNVAHYFLGCSKQAGIWLFGRKIVNSDRFFVLKNAIDINQFKFNSEVRRKVRETYHIKSELVVGHVGRFVSLKNHKFIIDVLSVLLKLTPAKLLLVGEGELMDEIKEYCIFKKVDQHVIFCGNRSDVADLMSAMDVFFLPSLYEGVPVTLVEAQAAGLPCLISDHISHEIDMGNIYRLNLNENANIWAKKLNDIGRGNKSRKNVSLQIKEKGFDIVENARWLEEFYLTIGEIND